MVKVNVMIMQDNNNKMTLIIIMVMRDREGTWRECCDNVNIVCFALVVPQRRRRPFGIQKIHYLKCQRRRRRRRRRLIGLVRFWRFAPTAYARP